MVVNDEGDYTGKRLIYLTRRSLLHFKLHLIRYNMMSMRIYLTYSLMHIIQLSTKIEQRQSIENKVVQINRSFERKMQNRTKSWQISGSLGRNVLPSERGDVAQHERRKKADEDTRHQLRVHVHGFPQTQWN